MDSYYNICNEESNRDLKKIISQQNETICKLKKKLDSYDVIVSERNNLQELCNDFQKRKENYEKEVSKMFTDLLNTFDIQSKKLKQAAAEDMKWKSKYCELQQINDSLTIRLDALKSNERNFKSKLSEVEKEKECIQKELCCVKVELKERNCDIKELKSRLKCYEEELCKVRNRLDECLIECNELSDIKTILEKDLKCTKIKLTDEKSRVSCLEEKLKFEGINLNDLKNKCQKLSELEDRCCEFVCKFNNERLTVKILKKRLEELKDVSENNYCKMKCQIQKLKEENCELKDELFCMRKK